MVSRLTNITQTDVDALATLANAIIGALPADAYNWAALANGYEFTYQDGDLLPPSGVTGAEDTGGNYDPGYAIIRVYSYKDFSGRLHYSKQYAIGALNVGSAGASVDWSWTAPAGGADGYIVVAGSPDGQFDTSGGLFGAFRNETSTSFTDDADTGWMFTDQFNVDGGGYVILNPVTDRAWLIMLKFIKEDLIYAGEIAAVTRDDTWLVSGPWCAAVGPVLRHGRASAAFRNIEFWYAADDHSGDVTVTTQAEIGTVEVPLILSNTLSPAVQADYRVDLAYNCPAAGTITGSITWTQTSSGAGWAHSLAVLSGSVTIDAETWTEVNATTLQLDFELSLPIGASSVRVEVTTASGNVTDGNASIYSTVALATETLTPTSETIIHPSSAGKKVVVTDLDTALGPVVFNSGNYYLSQRAGAIDGVWVALTFPPLGVHTYLENDLPNYPKGVLRDNSVGPRGSAPLTATATINPITPAVRARPSLWPVFRDTDFLEWKHFAGRTAPVPFFPGFNDFDEVATVTLAPDETYSSSLFLPSNFASAIIEAFDTTLPIYYSQTDTPDPDDSGTYDGSAASPLQIPTEFTPTPAANVNYTIHNNTAETVSFQIRTWLFTDGTNYHPGAAPEFFPRENDGRGLPEPYSYNFHASKLIGGSGGVNETPLSGYCIFELIVSRAATGGVFKTVPSTGEAELTVEIGLVRGTTSTSAGTFESLLTVTIPADTASVTETVFWPVLAGAALVYQCTEAVDVQAAVNYMPEVLVQFYPPRGSVAAGTAIYGHHSGPAFEDARVLRFTNKTAPSPTTEQITTLPVCTPVYNDLEAILNLL